MLSETQLRRVQYLVDDEWVSDTGSSNDDRITWENFHAALDTMGAEELHQYAANFNCDCGVKELQKVIQHPQCDLGTALMVFWRLGPGWYLQYAELSQVPYDERNEYELLTEIQLKVVAHQFSEGEIAINPKNLDNSDRTEAYNDMGGIARVAVEMFKPSPGRVVPIETLG